MTYDPIHKSYNRIMFILIVIIQIIWIIGYIVGVLNYPLFLIFWPTIFSIFNLCIIPLISCCTLLYYKTKYKITNKEQDKVRYTDAKDLWHIDMKKLYNRTIGLFVKSK